jgi:excisionase family DNA binding protein
MLSELFTLEQVAEQFQWSRRTLVRMLRQHAIATIGKGRRARLAAEDIETLKVKEREAAKRRMPPPEPSKDVSLARINASSMNLRMKQYWRRLGQIHRRRPGTK